MSSGSVSAASMTVTGRLDKPAAARNPHKIYQSGVRPRDTRCS